MADGSLIEKQFPGIAERARKAQERATAKAAQEAETPRQMFLPGMEEHMRAEVAPEFRSA